MSRLATAAPLYPQDTQKRPVLKDDGSVEVPAFELPPSSYLSDKALAQQKRRVRTPSGTPPPNIDIGTVGKGLEAMLASHVADMRSHYRVKVAEQKIANVPVRVVTPANGAIDTRRVLINLHGGGFSMCADACAMLESTPIAAEGKFLRI